MGMRGLAGIVGGLLSASLMLAASPALAIPPQGPCAALTAALESKTLDMDDRWRLSRQLKARYEIMQGDDLGIIDLAPWSHSIYVSGERRECWANRAGRPIDRRTREAVFAASEQQVYLTGLRFDFWDTVDAPFDTLSEGFAIERATGVFGPINREVRRRGVDGFRDDEDFSSLAFDPRTTWDSISTLEDTVIRLAAICVAEPRRFRRSAEELGYPKTLLTPNPSRLLIVADRLDPYFVGWSAYVDAEMDRILTECPA